MRVVRIKVGCINWGLPKGPKAISYALVNGEMCVEGFHATWADAMDRANRLADIYTKVHGRPAFKRRAS